ncbi:MAG TPA: hypothetical protein VEN82_07260 [Actinomycetota bacterium]|nr:hypothetical protein [Actinomycetota bacterium]
MSRDEPWILRALTVTEIAVDAVDEQEAIALGTLVLRTGNPANSFAIETIIEQQVTSARRLADVVGRAPHGRAV